MQEFVTINEKNYFPSTVLAGTFGYTPDYIGKLAREEKILGLLIGRVWFIEKNSLEVYLQKIAVEKNIQKEALRQLRKNERLAHERASVKKAVVSEKKYQSLVASSQAFALIACGVFIGGLGWVSVSKQLTPAVLSEGALEVLLFAGARLTPSFPQVEREPLSLPLYSNSLLAGVSGVESADAQENTAPIPSEKTVVFTTLPQSLSLESGAPQDTSLDSRKIQFSDEVRVVVDAQGEYYLEPVLRGAQDGESAGAEAEKPSSVRVRNAVTE